MGNTDLGKSSNVEALLEHILKDKPTEVEEPKVVVAVETTVEKPKISEPAPKPPLDFSKVKASYYAGDYRKAFNDAQGLAVQSDADAQSLLGKMFADGKGTLQVTTAAHMWFNIA